MPTFGLLTHDDRDLLHATADAIYLTPLSGCADLAAACQHLAQASPQTGGVTDLLSLTSSVHRALLAETAPDRWLPDLTSLGLPMSQAMDMAAGLVQERATQADLVAAVRSLVESLTAGHAAIA